MSALLEPRTPEMNSDEHLRPVVEHSAESIDAYLPQVEPASRDALNAWLTACGVATFTVEHRHYALEWDEPVLARMQFGAELSFGSRSVLVALDSFAAVDPLLVGEPFARMPSALRDLVAQRLIAQFLAVLPASLSDTADVRALHWHQTALPSWQCQLGFTLRRLPEGPQSQGVIATASPEELTWLYQKLPFSRSMTRSSRLSLAVPLHIVLGSTGVELRMLRDLQVGDVIWVESARPTREGVTATLLAVGSTQAWQCRIRHDSLRIAATRGDDHGLAEMFARHATHSGISGDPAMSTEPLALDVPVTFDLGKLNIAVHELEHIQPGRMFELPQDVADAAVSLRVAGKLIAEGKLVAIGRRIGVRVTSVRLDRQGETLQPAHAQTP